MIHTTNVRAWLFLLVATLFLSGCKLSGTAEGIVNPVLLEETESGEVITVTEDGEFSFEHEYEPNDPYQVIINSAKDECSLENSTGVFASDPINDVKLVCHSSPIACTKEYRPVCAAVSKPINCVTTPCLSPKDYKTFSNDCMARAAGAETVFTQACGEKEGTPVNAAKMVDFRVVRLHPQDPVQLNAVKIASKQRPYVNSDFLLLNLSYPGGCSDHTFSLFVDRNIVASQGFRPARTSARITHDGNNDLCEAFITEDVLIDLEPLKAQYKHDTKKAYGAISIDVKALNALAGSPSEGKFEVVYRFDDRPLGKEGDQCGGFTVWPGYPDCGEGLSCKGNTQVVDLPGVCLPSK